MCYITVMPKQIDLTGNQYGRITVVSFVGKRRWLCRCSCGNEKIIYSSNLTRGITNSCGCLARERASIKNSSHGYTRGYRPKSEYTTWQCMNHRCHNPSWINYFDYGGRGIYVCDRWRFGEGGKSAFECFIEDMGDKPTAKHTLDRIDSNLPYGPTNCRWATRREQSRNRRSNRIVSFRGEKMLLIDALTASGMSETGFYDRVKKGWTEQQALETPPFQRPSSP